jgi:hypothetical protein
MYIVGETDGTISIYIGDVQAGGGSGGNAPATASLGANALSAQTVKAEKEDI